MRTFTSSPGWNFVVPMAYFLSSGASLACHGFERGASVVVELWPGLPGAGWSSAAAAWGTGVPDRQPGNQWEWWMITRPPPAGERRRQYRDAAPPRLPATSRTGHHQR